MFPSLRGDGRLILNESMHLAERGRNVTYFRQGCLAERRRIRESTDLHNIGSSFVPAASKPQLMPRLRGLHGVLMAIQQVVEEISIGLSQVDRALHMNLT
jgi:hypothetical protein